MRRLPHLRVQVYTGLESIVELLAGTPEASRIEFFSCMIRPDGHAVEPLSRLYECDEVSVQTKARRWQNRAVP